MLRKRPPIGVILAGGVGRRIGGSKAAVQLAGQPLITYPLDAVRTALGDVAVIAKADTQLPSLPGVTVWVEPDSPRHPVLGIIQALAVADGRSVVVCAVDLPFVTPELIYRLATADLGRSPAVVACRDTDVQPLLGCYAPRALHPLRSLLAAHAPVRELVGSLHPRMLDVGDHELLFDIDSPEDLLHAAAILDGRARVGIPPAR
jgi:molybdopterin-guanine dinucleotide biosynthesis protein A